LLLLHGHASHVTLSLQLQIGDPAAYLVNATTGEGFWGPPWSMPPNREVLLINSTAPATSPATEGAAADVLAAAAAALAATSMVVKDMNPTFANATLSTAKVLYQEAVAMQPRANVTFRVLLPAGEQQPLDEGGAQLGVQDFGSSSVLDDMAHAATWLSKATGGIASPTLEVNVGFLCHLLLGAHL
jgi:hypothetical protein